MRTDSWVQRLNIGWLFKGYLRTLAALGQALPARKEDHAHTAAVSHEAGTAAAAETGQFTLEEADLEATAKGNHYRALGITIGLLGIVIVFLAIVPVGLELDPHTAHFLGGLKVVLMLVMLVVVVLGRRARTHQDWIRMRAQAEELRYRPLADLIAQADITHDEAATVALEKQLLAILEGPLGQIAYNESKARQYHAIERFSDFLLWASVGLALVGAFGHLFAEWSWWIFLTAFGPAAVGGVHGINGFLGVSSLVEEHQVTQRLLSKSLSDLKLLQVSPERRIGMPALAKSVLGILTSRDIRWKESAEKLGLRPA